MTEQTPINIDHLKSKDKAIIMLDMSKFDLFELCQWRYYCRHVIQRTLPIINKSRALDDGGLAHEGLEVYYKLIPEGIHFNDRCAAMIAKIKEKAADPDFSNSDPEDVAIVIKAVVESCTYWRQEDESLTIKAVEAPFVYILYEDEFVQIILSGKIDLFADKPGLGNSATYRDIPYDHKTFSRTSEIYRLSNQFMNYCVATNSLFIRINRIGLQKSLKPEEKYLRQTLSYDRELLQEWKNNVTAVILDEYMQCMMSGKWKQNFTSCSKFNRLCEYYKVCDTAGSDNKTKHLMLNYVQGSEWDVTAKFTKGK